MSDLIRPRFLPADPVPGPRMEGAPTPNQLMTVRGEAEFYDRRVDGAGSQVGGGGGGTAQYPFGAKISGTSLTVRPGTLNGQEPSNIGSTFTVPSSGTRYLVLNGTASSGVIASSSLAIETVAPSIIGTSLGFPPNAFKILLYVVVDKVLFRIIGPGSLQALPKEVFRIQKSAPTPDMLPYDSYYTWSISDV